MAKLLRLTGTYIGFQEFKEAMEKLPAPTSVIAEEIQSKYEAVNMAAKLDTCNLHYLIQEFHKLYIEKPDMREHISKIMESIGIEMSGESWGFKGESPEPIKVNARLVLN